MPDYHAVVEGGYKTLSQTSYSQASGATPFSAITGGRAYTLQVLTGKLKINFAGNLSDYMELGPGIYTDAVDWSLLKAAKVDVTSNYTAVLLLQGVN